MVKVYRHYKGGIYNVVGQAIHTETDERLVIYEDVRGVMWARPATMFHEHVEVDGERVLRFEYIGEFDRKE